VEVWTPQMLVKSRCRHIAATERDRISIAVSDHGSWPAKRQKIAQFLYWMVMLPLSSQRCERSSVASREGETGREHGRKQ
jgi:hypothetical protein